MEIQHVDEGAAGAARGAAVDESLAARGGNRSRTPRSKAFREFMSTGWAPHQDRHAAAAPVASFAAARRERLGHAFRGTAIVVPAGVTHARSNDTDFRFRPHSAFSHLTGWGADAVPGSVLVMLPKASGHEPTLFFRAPAGRDTPEFYDDPSIGEFWNGPRPGLDEVSGLLGIGTADLKELPTLVRSIAAPVVWIDGVDPSLDAVLGPTSVTNASLVQAASELRLVKDVWEVQQLRQAVAASHRGFDDILARLGVIEGHPRGERLVEGAFWARARELGNDVGYDTIAASGAHACYLHWTRNDGAVLPGDLLLVDAGVELDSLYTADVTRTVPVSGTFSPVQRRVYDAVLRAADEAFAAARPGVRFREIHDRALQVIGATALEWGLLPTLPGEANALEEQLHRRFMVHGTSHHLGLDVHDCAQARAEMYLDARLEPGMVFTIEPGLYFQADDLTVPPELRGIGVRIEDDILVTEDGVERLTEAIPRTPDAVEAWIARSHR